MASVAPESEEESFGELWKAVFESYYDAVYNEVLAEKLVDRWQLIDEVSKVLIAVAASGSALSGWALWSHPGYRVLWSAIAGSAALLGVLHSALGVTQRLKDWIEIKRAFATLRVELETLLYRMKFDFKATTRELGRQFVKHRRQYLVADQKFKNDLLLTRRLKINAQEEANRRLKDH